jgi:hypothetical protein
MIRDICARESIEIICCTSGIATEQMIKSYIENQNSDEDETFTVVRIQR